MSFLNKNTTLTILVTIILGSIGSGVWEWLLKPMLTSISEFGLDIATLWINSFKDSLYKRISFDFHEESSLKLYLFVFNMLPSFILGAMAGFIFYKNKTDDNLNNSTRTMFRPVWISITFILVFSIVQANQMSYINRAVTHFHVLMQIAGENLTEHQRVLYQSRFAQISSKDDYEKIIIELSSICHDANLKTPSFSIW